VIKGHNAEAWELEQAGLLQVGAEVQRDIVAIFAMGNAFAALYL